MKANISNPRIVIEDLKRIKKEFVRDDAALDGYVDIEISGDYYEDFQRLVPHTMENQPNDGMREKDMSNNDYDYNVDPVALRLVRTFLRSRYAFAIPTTKAISYIVENTPGKVMEIGAGNGYWAKRISDAGKNIEAYDIATTVEDNYYKFKGGAWFNVQTGGPESLVGSDAETLFLCWPHPRDELAFKSLQNFEGDHLIYVGEKQGGCTGDDKFFTKLNKEWKLVKTVLIPSWDGIYDDVYHFARKTNKKG